MPILSIKKFEKKASTIIGKRIGVAVVKDTLGKEHGINKKRLSKPAVNPNLESHKVKRYKCTEFLKELLLKFKTLISYDESWFSNLNHQSVGYLRKDSKFWYDTRRVTKRITSVGAIDSDGNSFLQLLEANGNASTTLIALAQLFKFYDMKDPLWKSKSVMLFDGCKFHRKKEVEQFISDHGV